MKPLIVVFLIAACASLGRSNAQPLAEQDHWGSFVLTRDDQAVNEWDPVRSAYLTELTAGFVLSPGNVTSVHLLDSHSRPVFGLNVRLEARASWDTFRRANVGQTAFIARGGRILLTGALNAPLGSPADAVFDPSHTALMDYGSAKRLADTLSAPISQGAPLDPIILYVARNDFALSPERVQNFEILEQGDLRYVLKFTLTPAGTTERERFSILSEAETVVFAFADSLARPTITFHEPNRLEVSGVFDETFTPEHLEELVAVYQNAD